MPDSLRKQHYLKVSRFYYLRVLSFFSPRSSDQFDKTGSTLEVCVFRQSRQDIEDYIVSRIHQHQFQQNNGQQASALHPQPQVW